MKPENAANHHFAPRVCDFSGTEALHICQIFMSYLPNLYVTTLQFNFLSDKIIIFFIILQKEMGTCINSRLLHIVIIEIYFVIACSVSLLMRGTLKPVNDQKRRKK